MATRYGGYCYEDNLEEMTIDKLQALKEVCDYTIKEKRREEIFNALDEINLRARAYGLSIVCEDSDGVITPFDELALIVRSEE